MEINGKPLLNEKPGKTNRITSRYSSGKTYPTEYSEKFNYPSDSTNCLDIIEPDIIRKIMEIISC